MEQEHHLDLRSALRDIGRRHPVPSAFIRYSRLFSDIPGTVRFGRLVILGNQRQGRSRCVTTSLYLTVRLGVLSGNFNGQVDQPGRSLRSQRRCREFKSRLVHS